MQAADDNLTFEEWWAELSDAVRAWLLRRRVAPHLVDDIVQETGLRLFKMWDEIDAMRSPRGLAFTIASNLLWDERNRHSAREIVGDVPEQSREDVERAGIARLELARVKRAMSRLNPQYRSVLLAEIGDDAAPAGSPDAVKMMRMRARRRLTALLDSAPAGIWVILRSPGRLWRAFRSARHGSAVSAPAIAIVAACTAIAVMGIPPSQPWFEDGAVTEARAKREAPSIAHATTRAVGMTSESTGQRGSSTSGDGSTTGGGADDAFHLDVGDGTPVHGHAGISIVSTGESEIEPPDCSAEPSGNNEVRVHCHAQAGDTEVTADTSLGIGP